MQIKNEADVFKLKKSIGNENIKISVDDFGAVLSNITSVKTGYEFMWQGLKEIWNGQSPILFPIIGKLLNDKCVIDGKEYSIIRHGLARHRNFELYSSNDSELIFLQEENDDTLKCYPFKYQLYVSFKIDENSLTVTHIVKNTNDRTMFFSIGAHPAFNCSIGDTITFEKNETLYSERIDKDSIITGKKDLIIDNSKEIEITEKIFNNDALIFDNVKSDYATLNLKGSGKKIKFSFGKAPFLAIWSKPAAPFVCIEPWYGINDSYEKKSSFSDKRGIVSIEPKDEFSFSWTALFIE